MIDGIIKQLPLEMHGYEAFQVADEKKITLDVNTGRYQTGEKETQLLYTIADLGSISLPGNTKYIQFIPDGTPYAILDFDTDKELSEEKREKQVEHIETVILDQFEGMIELSASGLGIHAYVKDKRLTGHIQKQVLKTDVGKINLEVFNGKRPITLTGNILERGVTPFDKLPKKLEHILEASTKEKASEPQPGPVDEVFTDEQLSKYTDRAKAIDKDNRIDGGYRSGDDCSQVDYMMAGVFLKATNNNTAAAKYLLENWMRKWRPKSHSPFKKDSEYKRKAGMAVDSVSAKEDAPKNDGDLIGLLMQGHEMTKEIVKRIGANPYLVPGMIQAGTLNTIVGASGSGKSKMVFIYCMEIAKKFPDRIIYYFANDVSGEDTAMMMEYVEAAGIKNLAIDGTRSGEFLMDVIEKLGDSNESSKLVIVVDTLKKITPVNNKDLASKTMAILRNAVNQGATLILIAHTNKDGRDMSGTAEFEQDADNVLRVQTEYIGDDKMKSTMSSYPGKRCRSRITPITYEMGRDGFDHTITDKVVNPEEQAQRKKIDERRGNIEETAISIIKEYADKGEELKTEILRKEIMSDDFYTGTKKTSFISDELNRMERDGLYLVEKVGRKKIFKPLIIPPFAKESE